MSADESPSVRDSINAAIEAAADPAPAPTAASAPASADAAAPAPTAAPESASAPASKSTVERDPLAPQQKFGEAPKPAAAPPSAAPSADALKAPASWKAGLREHWGTLAPDVQAEIVRREREIEDNLRASADVRKFQERFTEVVTPYRALIEAEGADPISAFHDYLKTATLLRTGAPGDKARALAQIVQQFGVPLDQLDAYLAASIQGRGLPQQMPQQQMPQQQMPQQPFRDPRVDEILMAQAAAQAAQVRDSVAAFGADPKHEFFADVRETMADVMDAAAKRGVQLSLEDAYARACQIEPEVKKVLDERAARSNVTQAAGTLARARHAASSLPPPSAAPAAKITTTGKPMSVREALEQSIDTLQNAA